VQHRRTDLPPGVSEAFNPHCPAASLCCTGECVLLPTEALGGPIINAGFGNRRYLNDIAIVPAAAPVPEPATLAVLTTGLLPAGLTRRR